MSLSIAFDINGKLLYINVPRHLAVDVGPRRPLCPTEWVVLYYYSSDVEGKETALTILMKEIRRKQDTYIGAKRKNRYWIFKKAISFKADGWEG